MSCFEGNIMWKANKTSIKILLLVQILALESFPYQKCLFFKNKIIGIEIKDKCIYRKLESQSIFCTMHLSDYKGS